MLKVKISIITLEYYTTDFIYCHQNSYYITYFFHNTLEMHPNSIHKILTIPMFMIKFNYSTNDYIKEGYLYEGF